MKLVAATCPNCGASIQIPQERDRTFCSYCGSQIITQAAIAFSKVQVEGTVQTRAADFDIRGGVLVEYLGQDVDVVIPDTVVEIGERAFQKYAYIRSVAIPEGVRAIGQWAFWQCSSLTSVTIPSTVVSIGDLAFFECGSLASVTIPSGVKKLGGAFAACTALRSVTIEPGVEEIGSAFDRCTSLESIALPATVKRISSTFCGCTALKSVDLPEGLEEIGADAFLRCSMLESIALPGSLKKIGRDAFFGCSALKSASLPEGLEEIGSRAFMGCPLEKFSLPSSLRRMHLDCLEAKRVVVPGNVEELVVGTAATEELVVDEGVKRLVGTECGGRSCGQYKLRKVSLPSSIQSVSLALHEESSSPDHHDPLFKDCHALESFECRIGPEAEITWGSTIAKLGRTWGYLISRETEYFKKTVEPEWKAKGLCPKCGSQMKRLGPRDFFKKWCPECRYGVTECGFDHGKQKYYWVKA